MDKTRHYEFYALLGKLLRRGFDEIPTTPDPVKLADTMREEAQIILERYRDLGADDVYKIVDSTLHLFYEAYYAQAPEVEAVQMNLFDLGKVQNEKT